MQGLVSRASVRHYASQRLHSPVSHICPLVEEVSGALAAIPAQACRQSRITELHALGNRYGEALVRRWQTLHDAPCAAASEEAATTQQAARLVCALQVVLHEAPGLLAKYLPDQSSEETPRMRPVAAQSLQAESVETVRWLLAQGAVGRHLVATYAAAMDPALHADLLGEDWRCAALRRMVDQRTPDAARLSAAGVMALRLYAHPSSGAFNLVRAWADLRNLCPDPLATRCVQEIPVLVGQAVQDLYAVPSARVWGNLYKGLQSRGCPRWQTGQTLTLDRPLSMTALAQESYAGRVVQGTPYNRELHLMDTPALRIQAVSIAAFHPVSTAPQAEVVVLPGQVYRFTGSEVRQEPAREGGAHAIERLTAQKIDEVPDPAPAR